VSLTRDPDPERHNLAPDMLLWSMDILLANGLMFHDPSRRTSGGRRFGPGAHGGGHGGHVNDLRVAGNCRTA
jgi:hypothetical protein